MKTITRNYLDELKEMLPILVADEQRKVVGGMTVDEAEQYLLNMLGNRGSSYYDYNGNLYWSSDGYSWTGIGDSYGNMTAINGGTLPEVTITAKAPTGTFMKGWSYSDPIEFLNKAVNQSDVDRLVNEIVYSWPVIGTIVSLSKQDVLELRTKLFTQLYNMNFRGPIFVSMRDIATSSYGSMPNIIYKAYSVETGQLLATAQ